MVTPAPFAGAGSMISTSTRQHPATRSHQHDGHQPPGTKAPDKSCAGSQGSNLPKNVIQKRSADLVPSFGRLAGGWSLVVGCLLFRTDLGQTLFKVCPVVGHGYQGTDTPDTPDRLFLCQRKNLYFFFGGFDFQKLRPACPKSRNPLRH